MNSEETVKAIKRVEKEIERRKSLPIYTYNTGAKIHEKQVAFHKCKKRNRWVFGGNRSGKTECGAVETVYMARGIHPYRENRKDREISFNRRTRKSLSKSRTKGRRK